MPDSGVEAEACYRSWQLEVGGEEEIEFLTEVTVKEMESFVVSNWDYAMRSHMLRGGDTCCV